MLRLTGIWLATLGPSVPLLCIFWAFRRVLITKKFEMRMLLMRGEGLTKYLSAYGNEKVRENTGNTDEVFVNGIVNQIFRLQYGTSEYVPAILCSVFISGLLSALAIACAGIPLGLPNEITTHLPATETARNLLAGGFGAVLWSTYEFAERYRSGDLAPDSIFRMSARTLLMSATGVLIGSVITEHLAWPIAFGLGVLPISAIRNFVSSRTLNALNILSAKAIEAEPPFTCLQGWNDDVNERLLRAGISSVEQLACTNPFQIYLRSNLDWRVILDLCDQALLAVYIGEKMQKLKPLGFRSAVELAVIDWEKEDTDFFVDIGKGPMINAVAAALEMSEVDTRMLIRSISKDITVSLIATLWFADTPGDHHEDEDEDEEIKGVRDNTVVS